MRTVKLLALVVSYALFAVVLSGCEEMGVMKWFNKEGPTDKDIARAYHLTELRRSTAADVLPMIYMPDHSLLSQSAKVLAAQGEMQKGNKTWLTMISFDENDLLAKHKYLMFVYDYQTMLMLLLTVDTLKVRHYYEIE